MSTSAASATRTPAWGRLLGLSSSQAAVRGVLLAASLALTVVTLVAAPQPVVLVAAAVLGLASWSALRPESPWANVLVAVLALHWVATVPVPATTRGWVLLLAAAWLLLVVHLATALAASLPPGAPVPAASIRRWGRRGATVAAATVPLWALSFLAGRQAVPGEVALTYAAIVATAVLALAVWLLGRDPHP